MCYGGILLAMVVYCVLERCTVCYGDVLCDRAVCCVIGDPLGVVQCGRVMYCVFGWCIVC